MLTIRWDFPLLSSHQFCDDAPDSNDRQFHREIVDLVKARATRKQLGHKFDGYQLVVDNANQLLAVDFHFLGENSHGAYHTVGPFMRDLDAELKDRAWRRTGSAAEGCVWRIVRPA